MKRFQIIFITFLVLALLSCDKKEKDEMKSIYGKWEATDLYHSSRLHIQKKMDSTRSSNSKMTEHTIYNLTLTSVPETLLC
jgi:hypothetical protein